MSLSERRIPRAHRSGSRRSVFENLDLSAKIVGVFMLGWSRRQVGVPFKLSAAVLAALLLAQAPQALAAAPTVIAAGYFRLANGSVYYSNGTKAYCGFGGHRPVHVDLRRQQRRRLRRLLRATA